MLIQLSMIWAFFATILKLAGVSFMATISWYLILLPFLLVVGAWTILFFVIALFTGSKITLTKKK